MPSFTLRTATGRYDPAMFPRTAFAVLMLLPFATPVRAEVHEALDYDHYDALALRGHSLAAVVNAASRVIASAHSGQRYLVSRSVTPL